MADGAGSEVAVGARGVSPGADEEKGGPLTEPVGNVDGGDDPIGVLGTAGVEPGYTVAGGGTIVRGTLAGSGVAAGAGELAAVVFGFFFAVQPVQITPARSKTIKPQEERRRMANSQ